MRSQSVAAIAAGALFLGGCASAPQPQAITLTAQTMTYSPSTFEVTAGVPVDLTFVNEDALEHDFSVLEIPVESGAGVEPVLHGAAEPGATNNLTFTPTKPGTYEFFCTVAGHKEAGMVGTMVVLAR